MVRELLRTMGDVTENWGLTYDDRKRMLERNIEIDDYFEKFPALRQPLGYTLVSFATYLLLSNKLLIGLFLTD